MILKTFDLYDKGAFKSRTTPIEGGVNREAIAATVEEAYSKYIAEFKDVIPEGYYDADTRRNIGFGFDSEQEKEEFYKLFNKEMKESKGEHFMVPGIGHFRDIINPYQPEKDYYSFTAEESNGLFDIEPGLVIFYVTKGVRQTTVENAFDNSEMPTLKNLEKLPPPQGLLVLNHKLSEHILNHRIREIHGSY